MIGTVMPVPTILHMKGVEVVSGATSIVASGYSGLEIAGTIGGIIGSLTAVGALALSVASVLAKRRRDYTKDLREAEQRGEDRIIQIIELTRPNLAQQIRRSARHPRPYRRDEDDGVEDDDEVGIG